MSILETTYDDQGHTDAHPPRQRQESSGFMNYLLPFPESNPDISGSTAASSEQQYMAFANAPPPMIAPIPMLTAGAFSMNGNTTGYNSAQPFTPWAAQTNQYADFLGVHEDQNSGMSAFQHGIEPGKFASFNSQGQLVPFQSIHDQTSVSQPLETAAAVSQHRGTDDWVECSEATVKSSNRVGHVYRVQGWSPSPNDQHLVSSINPNGWASVASYQGKAVPNVPTSRPATSHSTIPQPQAGPSHTRTGSVEANAHASDSRKPSQKKWARRSGYPASALLRKKRDASGARHSSDALASGSSRNLVMPLNQDELPSDFSIKLYDPWASARSARAEGSIGPPASAPPSEAQVQFADISRLQAKPSPHLARLITLAASKTFAGQEQSEGPENVQQPPGDLPPQYGGEIRSALVNDSSNMNLVSFNNTCAFQNAETSHVYSGTSTIPLQGDAPGNESMVLTTCPQTGRPMYALEYSSSTRRRALQRSTTFGPGAPSARPLGMHSSQSPQFEANPSVGNSIGVVPPFRGPYNRTVSEGIIPNIASSLIARSTAHVGSPPRTLLDDIAAAVGPPTKKFRFS